MAEPEVTCPNPSRAAYNWPNVPKPTNAEKKIWTETICLMYNITNNDRHVRGHLNRAWENNTKPHTQWRYDRDNNEIYKKKRRMEEMEKNRPPRANAEKYKTIQPIPTTRDTGRKLDAVINQTCWNNDHYNIHW